jgi:transcription elongation factor Elf1
MAYNEKGEWEILMRISDKVAWLRSINNRSIEISTETARKAWLEIASDAVRVALSLDGIMTVPQKEAQREVFTTKYGQCPRCGRTTLSVSMKSTKVQVNCFNCMTSTSFDLTEYLRMVNTPEYYDWLDRQILSGA